jgi:hypothetical protein
VQTFRVILPEALPVAVDLGLKAVPGGQPRHRPVVQRLQRHILQEGVNLEDEAAEEELLQEADVFHIEQDENVNEDFLYVVKKSLIIDEWRKRCFVQERKKRIDAKSVFKISNLKNRLQKAFEVKFSAFANKDKDDLFKNKRNNFDLAKRMGA